MTDASREIEAEAVRAAAAVKAKADEVAATLKAAADDVLQHEAVNAAEVLATALAQNTEALRVVRNRSRWAIFASGVAVLAVVFNFYIRHETRVASCHQDNRLRRSNVALWEPLLAADRAPTHPGPDATPEELDKYNRQIEDRIVFQKTLDVGFALADCDSIGWIR